MPSYSGIWTLSQQFQGRGQGLWPATPGAPTIGTATVVSATSASVPFTAPACAGVPATITGYTATSTPGCITGTGSSSPITVSGLTACATYTFKVKAQNATGFGACSAASNSLLMRVQGQTAYTTPGSYSFVVPAGVTSISVVAVGGGAGGRAYSGSNGYDTGGGGGLRWSNNISVTPGETLSVSVGVGGAGTNNFSGNSGGNSSVRRGCVAFAQGNGGSTYVGGGGSGTGTTGGGNGGNGSTGVSRGGGGGAAGYSGNGGAGATSINGFGGSGGGAGGGASGGTYTIGCCTYNWSGGGGGGVGLLGEGASGAGGTRAPLQFPNYTPGGSGGGTSRDGNSGREVGGLYGGGGGGAGTNPAGNFYVAGCGGNGAVRIIWPGNTRLFPSTNTGDL